LSIIIVVMLATAAVIVIIVFIVARGVPVRGDSYSAANGRAPYAGSGSSLRHWGFRCRHTPLLRLCIVHGRRGL